MAPEEKKSIFEKAVDLVSSRDEKEALDKAQQELEAAKKAASEAQAKASTASAAAQAQAKMALDEARRKAADAEARLRGLEAQMRAMRAAEAQRVAAQVKAAAAPKIIAEHTVKQDETLGKIALKYYGSAAKPYYMVIYEANKAAIGSSPNRIKTGLKLQIPELPDELRKK